MTTRITLDRDTLDSLAGKLEQTAVGLSEPERAHLTALLAVGAAEVASGAGIEPADDESRDLLGSGVRGALRPLTRVGPAPEVEPFNDAGGTACYKGFGNEVCVAVVIGTGASASIGGGTGTVTTGGGGSGTTTTTTTTTSSGGSGGTHR